LWFRRWSDSDLNGRLSGHRIADPKKGDAVDATRRSNRGPPSRREHRVVRAGDQSRNQLERAVWERVMRRLRVGSGLLAAVLLALVARMIISGVTLTLGVSATIIVVLLAASLMMTAHGRRLEPPRPLDRSQIGGN
jgi:hypothetical protein